MDCPIKTIPSDIILAGRYGNKGLGFPLTSFCGAMVAEVAQECYLALEYENDGGFGSPLMQEFANLQGTGEFGAPCLSSTQAYFCYLALEEDGFTPFETEEPSPDYFEVSCI